jgi:Flp pilus assembly protein TadB
MAQTKKKRQTKHRGTAAGTVSARGRTGRKPTAAERSPRSGTRAASAAERREARLNTPPTWQGALQRAGIATVFFFVVLLLFFKNQGIGPKIGIAAFMLAIYVPMGYYTDLYMYRRRQRKKAEEAATKKDDA